MTNETLGQDANYTLAQGTRGWGGVVGCASPVLLGVAMATSSKGGLLAARAVGQSPVIP